MSQKKKEKTEPERSRMGVSNKRAPVEVKKKATTLWPKTYRTPQKSELITTNEKHIACNSAGIRTAS